MIDETAAEWLQRKQREAYRTRVRNRSVTPRRRL